MNPIEIAEMIKFKISKYWKYLTKQAIEDKKSCRDGDAMDILHSSRPST